MAKESRQKFQRKAHEFLLDKYVNIKTFTQEEFQKYTGWGPNTVDTYWPKQYETLLLEITPGTYRVSDVFRRFTDWKNFQKHVSQKRNVASDYTKYSYDNVMMFEFFMPLSNEGYLRTALDDLFYKDTIMAKLKAGLEKIKKRMTPQPDEDDISYLGRICQWVGDHFGGYSITHVNGRYRAGQLLRYREVAELSEKRCGRYLVDETTAIVRFIFPCGKSTESKYSGNDNSPGQTSLLPEEDVSKEADLIWFFFQFLFVRSIVEIVNGEDEIWLLESGMHSRLHIWRVKE